MSNRTILVSQSSIPVHVTNPMWNPHNEHCIESFSPSYEHYGICHPGIFQQNVEHYYPYYHTQQQLQSEQNPVYYPQMIHQYPMRVQHPNMMYAPIPLHHNVMHDKPDVYRMTSL